MVWAGPTLQMQQAIKAAVGRLRRLTIFPLLAEVMEATPTLLVGLVALAAAAAVDLAVILVAAASQARAMLAVIMVNTVLVAAVVLEPQVRQAL